MTELDIDLEKHERCLIAISIPLDIDIREEEIGAIIQDIPYHGEAYYYLGETSIEDDNTYDDLYEGIPILPDEVHALVQEEKDKLWDEHWTYQRNIEEALSINDVSLLVHLVKEGHVINSIDRVSPNSDIVLFDVSAWAESSERNGV